jgi:hypothetical protein
MAERRRRRIKPIPLQIGNDPSLWRFASLQEALEANTHLISSLIRASQSVSQLEEPKIDQGEPDDIATLDAAAR